MAQYIYGIDLGTTNSSIGLYTGTDITIFKNKEHAEATPSAVHVTKAGRIIVGHRAKNKVLENSETVALEFKRVMGYHHQEEFHNGICLSPEELSAEVLKSLIDDVKRAKETTVQSAVIAVPASFGTLQCEATMRAAQHAGIDEVYLIQEPIAAAIAYGANQVMDDETALVYDLGGGTFDVAVVSSTKGDLRILSHKGDNFLGGKDFDKTLVDQILLPILSDNFDLPSADHHPELFSDYYKKLLRIAEQVKWDLTEKQETEAVFDELDGDLLGQEIDADIVVTREEFDALIAPAVNNTLRLADQALEKAGITPGELTRVVMVGGPTQIPFIRKRLREYYGVPVDTSLDPITAVTHGAALYAYTLRSAVTEKDGPAMGFDIDLQYDEQVSKASTIIQGRITSSKLKSILEIHVQGISGSWVTVEPTSGFFELEVPLIEKKSNLFQLEGRNRYGQVIDLTHPIIQIEHRSWSVANPPLPHTISIEVLQHQSQSILTPVINHGTVLPAVGKTSAKAAHHLRPSDYGESLAIKLWEGECFDEPDANTWIGNVYLSAKDLTRPIPQGQNIEITVKVDLNRMITIELEVPGFDIFTSEQVYISDAAVYDPLDKKDELSSHLKEYYMRLHNLNEYSIENEHELVAMQVGRIFEEVEEFDLAFHTQLNQNQHDSDSFARLLEMSKKVRSEIVELESNVRSTTVEPNRSPDLLSLQKHIQTLLKEHGNETDKKHLELLKKQAEVVVSIKDKKGVERIETQMKELRWQILSRQPEYWINMFHQLRTEEFKNENLARKYISTGEEAITAQNWSELENICRSLWRLMKPEAAEVLKDRSVTPGVRQ